MKVGSAAAGVLVGVLLMPGPAAPAVGAAGLVVTGVTVQVRAGEVEVAIAASGPVGYRVQELLARGLAFDVDTPAHLADLRLRASSLH